MSLPDCRECKHSTAGHDDTFCTRFKDPMSISWRRDDRNECKRVALFFDPKEKKK